MASCCSHRHASIGWSAPGGWRPKGEEKKKKRKGKGPLKGAPLARPPTHSDWRRCGAMPPTARAPHVDTAAGEVGQTNWQRLGQQQMQSMEKQWVSGDAIRQR